MEAALNTATAKRRLRSEIFTPANVITMVRIFAALLIALLYDGDKEYAILAAGLFGLAAICDAVDGAVARRTRSTTFGQFLDPLADKLTLAAIYFRLVHLDRLPVWVAILILSREIGINELRDHVASTIPSSILGKVKTHLQLWGAAFLLEYYPTNFGLERLSPINFQWWGMLLTYLSLIASLVSAWQYLWGLRKMIFEE